MIKRVTDPSIGPLDGVEADVNCVLTSFDSHEDPMQRKIQSQTTMPCTILSAYSEGTISFSMREVGLMATIRIDELYAILVEAANVASELSVLGNLTDEILEQKWQELKGIPCNESDSPFGLILAEDWWIFQEGADVRDVYHFFNENHSKGVDHLLNKYAE
jgi:hypothetical protein